MVIVTPGRRYAKKCFIRTFDLLEIMTNLAHPSKCMTKLSAAVLVVEKPAVLEGVIDTCDFSEYRRHIDL